MTDEQTKESHYNTEIQWEKRGYVPQGLSGKRNLLGYRFGQQ